MDLSQYIDATRSEILNAKGALSDVFAVSNEETAAAALPGVSSECDPQILITLQFKEPIKLASIKFVSNEASTSLSCVGGGRYWKIAC